MIKILSIGNSFSQDATAYLHDMAKQGNIETKVVNLYIGGCSLSTHWENAQNDAAEYEYELNGHSCNRKISVKEALLEDDWCFVTMQQASYDSGFEETYYPYITQLSDYIKQYSPKSEQLIHQTWAYEIDSTHSAFVRYESNQIKMYKVLKATYKGVAQTLGLALIPCGDVIQALRELEKFDYLNGGQSLCRDGFHMHLVYGRYAVAATWYEHIAGGNILENDYRPPAIENNVDEQLIQLIRQTVHGICR